MDPTIDTGDRLTLQLRAAPAEALLAIAVRGVLRPLPSPRAAATAPAGGGGVDWDAVLRVPLDDRRESSFTSTVRVVKRDLWRKLADQEPSLAGRGPVPKGFRPVHLADPGPGRAPLYGHLHPPPAAGAPTVVLLHGLYDSKQSRYVRVIGDWLARLGCGVLSTDARWHGRLLEQGWLPTLGLEESADLLAWGRWLKGSYPATRLGLVGFSLGSLSLLHTLARADAGELFEAGGVAFSPPGPLRGVLEVFDRRPSLSEQGLDALILRGFHRYLRQRMSHLAIPFGPRPFSRFLEWLCERIPAVEDGRTESLLAQVEPEALVPGVSRPLLIVNAEDDPVFPPGNAAELERIAGSNPAVRVVRTPHGGHIGHMGTYPGWTAEILARFFRP